VLGGLVGAVWFLRRRNLGRDRAGVGRHGQAEPPGPGQPAEQGAGREQRRGAQRRSRSHGVVSVNRDSLPEGPGSVRNRRSGPGQTDQSRIGGLGGGGSPGRRFASNVILSILPVKAKSPLPW